MTPIVHFCSDNGPSWVTPFGTTGGLRGQKGDVLEGGIRVPGIIEWPAKWKGGRSVDVPMSTDDLLPTIASLAGAQAPTDRPLDGEDVMPILEGTADGRTDPLVFRSLLRVSSGDWKARTADQSAVVDGKWKLVSVDDDHTFQLYDLGADPREEYDVAADHAADEVKKLRDVLDAKIKSFAASSARRRLQTLTRPAGCDLTELLRLFGHCARSPSGRPPSLPLQFRQLQRRTRRPQCPVGPEQHGPLNRGAGLPTRQSSQWLSVTPASCPLSHILHRCVISSHRRVSKPSSRRLASCSSLSLPYLRCGRGTVAGESISRTPAR